MDTGSETFARFRYQAEVTLPFCLSCALSEDIHCVVPEHLEDIALETGSGWRFIQVKSRDLERGLWTLKDILGDRGALRSLFRTYQQVYDTEASMELILEGATKPRDPIRHLRQGADHRHPDLLAPVAAALVVREDEAASFLERVFLLKPPQTRTGIRDTNLRLIHEQNRSLNHEEVSKIHIGLIVEIERAMGAEAIGEGWPRYVTHPSEAPSDAMQKLEAKRITRERIRTIIAPIVSSPRYLLRRFVDRAGAPVSVLEQKMRAGGATDALVNRGRILRMNARTRWEELRARSLYSGEEQLEDLHERLETYFTAQKDLHSHSPSPTVTIWNGLLGQFTVNPTVVDPNSVMQADPMLLLGEVCELADLCLIDFGTTTDAD